MHTNFFSLKSQQQAKQANFLSARFQRRRLLCMALLTLGFALLSHPLAALAESGSILYQLPYQWVNDNGQATRLQHFKGKPSILVMSYGACKKVCSTSLMRMEQMQALLDQNKIEANFVIVGLDPVNDRPEDWRSYRQLRKLERSNWYFLSGSAVDIKSLAAQLGVNYWVYHDHIMHDFVITLLDKDGNTMRRMLNGGDKLEQFLQPILSSTNVVSANNAQASPNKVSH